MHEKNTRRENYDSRVGKARVVSPSSKSKREDIFNATWYNIVISFNPDFAYHCCFLTLYRYAIELSEYVYNIMNVYYLL